MSSMDAAVLSNANETYSICQPTNFNYIWWPIRGHWFTQTKTEGTWSEVADLCASIEPGRTNPASIRSRMESNLLKNKPLSGGLTGFQWTGGARVGSKWFWYGDNGPLEESKKVTPLDFTHWTSTRPGDPTTDNTACMSLELPSHQWVDILCESRYYGLCELRCGH